MKITISKNDLLTALNKVKGVVASKSALPVLSNVLMEAEGSAIKVTSTDLKITIEFTVDCTVHEAGAATVPCQRIIALLSDLSDIDVNLSLSDNNILELQCGLLTTKLLTIAADEFPPVRDFSGIDPMSFKQASLKKLFQKTAYAICTDQSRHNLTGLLMETKADGLRVVATDGRRLSLAVSDEVLSSTEEVKPIIPAKTIQELQSLLSDDEEKMVDVYLADNRAAFVCEDLRITTALIEGNFPNYEAVIPKKMSKEFILELDNFRQCMRRASSMTNDKFRTVKFIFDDDNMQIIVKTPDVGEYEECIPVGYQGEKLEITFNPVFILEVLRYIEGHQVCLQFKDGNNPGVIKPYTEAPVDNYINVIMPIRG